MSRRGALLLAAGGLALLSGPAARPAAQAAPPALGGPPVRPEIEALLARRAEALLGLDVAGLLATVAPEARPAQQAVLARQYQVPFAELFYRLTAFEEPDGADRFTASADLGHRLHGIDDHPALMGRTLEFVRTGGGWLLAGDEPSGAAALWDLGTVQVVRGRRSLVLGLAEVAELAKTAAIADLAVPAVEEVWGDGWAGRLLIETPQSEQQFARLLGVSAGDYQGIAAVTTAAAGAPHGTAADRVLLNPEAYAGLSDLGRRVVTTHETTHVATRADTRPWTPLWLSEGVADYTGYRGRGRTARQITPELTSDVAAGRLPSALPLDADFAAGSAGIAQAYELAWLACDLIARQWGEPHLVALYRAVGASDPGSGRAQALDGLFRSQLGIGLDEFTSRWLSEVRRLPVHP
ncbi:hypothetical protein [Kitasatospora sp. GP82]|uniref:hypothetical protein n=1 Tax=Kitasatospora sp. GP82 TaxID=3035089 RepID=UPI002474DB56|nr:hypothetical protein [Kitasatospora sp. GP82]MDH6127255.1 hypothetical protein [Kitasatospora sp. GP82]